MTEKTPKNEIPEELFQKYGKDREYKFIGLDGKEKRTLLRESDCLSPNKCAIDGTNLVMRDDGVYEWNPECPCCKILVGLEDYTEEQKENYLKKEYLPDLQKEIKDKKAELEKLEKLERIVSNRDSEIIKKNRENSCYNKGDLSAQKKTSKDFETDESYHDYMRSFGYGD